MHVGGNGVNWDLASLIDGSAGRQLRCSNESGSEELVFRNLVRVNKRCLVSSILNDILMTLTALDNGFYRCIDNLAERQPDLDILADVKTVWSRVGFIRHSEIISVYR